MVILLLIMDIQIDYRLISAAEYCLQQFFGENNEQSTISKILWPLKAYLANREKGQRKLWTFMGAISERNVKPYFCKTFWLWGWKYFKS